MSIVGPRSGYVYVRSTGVQGIPGIQGKSPADIWREQPGNSGKTDSQYVAWLSAQSAAYAQPLLDSALAAQVSASLSAATATTQAGIATTGGTTATTQAGISTTKAGEANASAIAAAGSQGAANTSATAAETARVAAVAAKVAAETAKAAAETALGTVNSQVVVAQTAASSANTSAIAAGTAYTNADTARSLAVAAKVAAEAAQSGVAASAATAPAQAVIATTQAGIATTKAGEANASAIAADGSKTAAQTAAAAAAVSATIISNPIVDTLNPGADATFNIVGGVAHLGIPRGITGVGTTGAQGPKGDTPTFTIGSVLTGAPGSSVTVTLVGVAPNYVMNLTIPAGAVGASGGAANFTDVDMIALNTLTPTRSAVAYVRDAQKSGEIIGQGTGCPVFGDGTNWLRFYDNGKAIPDLPTLPGGQSFLTDADGTYLVENGNYLTE
jgi:hypothetical protein